MRSAVRRRVLAAVMCVVVWSAVEARLAAQDPREFVGSETCQACHPSIYERWHETLMANILQDAQADRSVILGDFSTPNDLVTFGPEDIDFTYGSKWKQRYFTRVGDDYYVFPVQWDVQNRVWRRYYVQEGTDWWVPFYPAEQMARPTGPLCDGCHSTNYAIETKTVTEWNVGCEKCHGPGSAHAASLAASDIVNPAVLDEVRANDICIQCHSQGQPRENPIAGQYYDWPVGYLPGERLSEYWALEEHHLGEETFTHWPEGSATRTGCRATTSSRA